MTATRPQRSSLAYFLMVAAGVFLSTMDSSMTNIALPYIMEDFGISLAKVQWVVLIYLLTVVISLLFWGKISDRCGKGIFYLIGMAVFSIGALCCAIAGSFAVLIAFRFVQGLGAAMMMATGAAILRTVAPHDAIGKWLGSLGIATSLGLMSGPLFGGLLLHSLSWHAIFLVNVPVGAIVVLLGWLFLAGTLPKKKAAEESLTEAMDWQGALIWAGVVLMAVLLLNSRKLFSPVIVLAVLFGLAALLGLLYRVESVKADPFLPLELLQQRFFAIAMTVVALSFAVLFFVLILMPLYLKLVVGLSSDRIGYMMMAVPASLFIVAPLAGRLFDRIGGVYLTSLGLCITGCATVLLAIIHPGCSLLDIAWRLALLGCGQSIFLSPNSASVLSRVNVEDTGVTAGMLATCRNLGMLSGVALVSLLFSFFFTKMSGGATLQSYSPEHMVYFVDAFRVTLLIGAAIAFVSAALSLARK
jgi:EmrB/QacA subfamily drug resistance transporter